MSFLQVTSYFHLAVIEIQSRIHWKLFPLDTASKDEQHNHKNQK